MILLPGWATTSSSGQPFAGGRGDTSVDQTIHHRIPATENIQINRSPRKLKYSPPPSSPPPCLRSKSTSLPSLTNDLSTSKRANVAKCDFSKKTSSDHAKSTSPVTTADSSNTSRHRAIKPVKQKTSKCMKLPSSYTMKLKERLVLGFSFTAVLFTLILVIDLQMDLGMSGHHLVPSHGRVKFGDGGVDGPGSAYNSFRKRFLQRSNNGSREMSSGGATTNNNVASQQQDGVGGVLSDGKKVSTTASQQKLVEEEPHDDFSDLLDYVVNNVDNVNKASEVDVIRSSAGAGKRKSANPTLGEIHNIKPR